MNKRLGKYSVVVDGDNADECKKQCEEDQTINCVSFDYLTTTKKCYLALNDRTDGKLIDTADYEYHERFCDSGCI